MIRQHLIDAIVRQTTVLIASLATAGGRRAPMAHFADRVFTDLVSELEAQGIGKKVGADMFGMALRTYQRRVQSMRASANASTTGPSLWQRLLEELDTEGPLSRVELEDTFPEEEPVMVAAVLRDLRDSGLVTSKRVKDKRLFFPVAPPDAAESKASLELLVSVILYRRGPMSRQQLQASIRAPKADIDHALSELLDSAAVVEEKSNAETMYRSRGYHIPQESEAGWEAALLDHYSSVVQTFCTKLQSGSTSTYDDTVGGSTYSMVIWPGHPLEQRVLRTLKKSREDLGALRKEVRAYNEGHPPGPGAARITSYVGQNAISLDDRPGEDAGSLD